MNQPKHAPRKKQKFAPYKVRIGNQVMWQVNLESRTVEREDGRRVRIRPRKTFASAEEAKTYAELKAHERRNHGTAAVSMPERLRAATLEAAEILHPFEGDCASMIVEAVREYAARRELSARSETVERAVTSFLKTKKSERLRQRYLEDLRSRLGRFARDFGDRKVSALNGGELDSWLRDLSQAPLSTNTYHLRLHTFFEYCRLRGWLAANPLRDVPKAKVGHDRPIGILSVDQVARLLEHADPETLPYWVFGIFCGLRSAEVPRLDWSDVHWDEKLVQVPALKSKTASRRFVQLRPNVLLWLAPYRDKDGPICPRSLDERLLADRKAAGIMTWPANACRHSFASYHLACFRDPKELALELGHSHSELIFKCYRELVKPDAGKRFWEVVPVVEGAPLLEVVA